MKDGGGPAQLGLGGVLQLRGPAAGVALDVADAVPELAVGLGVRPQGFHLGGQFRGPGVGALQGGGLGGEVVHLGVHAAQLLFLLRRFQPQGLYLAAQGVVFLLQCRPVPLQLLHLGGILLGDLFNIGRHVLLVKAAEGDALEGVIVHALHRFLCIIKGNLP